MANKKNKKFSIVTREAKLFEAGEYKDKGMDVSAEDLDTYVANFKGAEIKIEHEDSAFDGVLGFCSKIWKKGKEIFGTIAFPDYVWELMNAAGAKSLSVGFSSSLQTFTEISIVKSPRVADAQVFKKEGLTYFSSDDEVTFTELSSETIAMKIESAIYNEFDAWGYVYDSYPSESYVVAKVAGKYYRCNYSISGTDVKIDSSKEVMYRWEDVTESDSTLDDVIPPTSYYSKGDINTMTDAEKIAKLEAENAELKRTTRINFASGVIERFKNEGKLIPASEEYAKAILMADDNVVRFNQEDTSISSLFMKFLESNKKVIEFSETTHSETPPADGQKPGDNKIPEGIDPDHIAFMVKRYPNMTEKDAIEQLTAMKNNELVEF